MEVSKGIAQKTSQATHSSRRNNHLRNRVIPPDTTLANRGYHTDQVSQEDNLNKEDINIIIHPNNHTFTAVIHPLIIPKPERQVNNLNPHLKDHKPEVNKIPVANKLEERREDGVNNMGLIKLPTQHGMVRIIGLVRSFRLSRKLAKFICHLELVLKVFIFTIAVSVFYLVRG